MARQLKYNLNNRTLTVQNMLLDSIDIQNDSDRHVYTFGQGATATASTSQRKIAEFDKTKYGSGKFVIQSTNTNNNEVLVTQVLLVHDGATDVELTEYGTLFTGSTRLVNFDCRVSGDLVELLSTTTTSDQTEFKVTMTLIAI